MTVYLKFYFVRSCLLTPLKTHCHISKLKFLKPSHFSEKRYTCGASARSLSSSSGPSKSNRKLLLLIGFISGSFLGVSIGFVAAKYPFLLAKAGLRSKVESFITQPLVSRSETPQANSFIRICEAIIKISETALISTIDNSDHDIPSPKCRPVQPYPALIGIPFIYFTTNKLSRKLSQIRENSKVTLTYYDKEGASYVVVEGEAQILDDANSAALWKDELILFYPEGPPRPGSEDASRFVVVKVHPKRMEFCSGRFAVETAYASWLPAALNRDEEAGCWMVAPETKIK